MACGRHLMLYNGLDIKVYPAVTIFKTLMSVLIFLFVVDPFFHKRRMLDYRGIRSIVPISLSVVVAYQYRHE